MSKRKNAECVVEAYIQSTHGGLLDFCGDKLRALCVDNECFQFSNECERWTLDQLVHVFAGWASTVINENKVDIEHIIGNGGNQDDVKRVTVAASWQTSYRTAKSGVTFHGTNLDISNRRVDGFQVFAFFTLVQSGDDRWLIERVKQRSDSARRHLGLSPSSTW
jgi:hypothetical protein